MQNHKRLMLEKLQVSVKFLYVTVLRQRNNKKYCNTDRYMNFI